MTSPSASTPPETGTVRLPRVPLVNPRAIERLWQVLDGKTKPPRSLGRLEELAVRFGALRLTPEQAVTLPVSGRKPIHLSYRAAVVVAAADHGVVDEGVSAFPQSVTEQMLLNFEAGGAAINALCKAAGAELFVVDVGTKRANLADKTLGAKEAEPATTRVTVADLSPVRDLRIRAGSANLARQNALELHEVQQAINLGLDMAVELDRSGTTVVALGEMGIGNTTVASVLTAAFCGVTDPAAIATLVGRGTGVDDAGLQRKRATVERALKLHNPDPNKPWEVLTQVGGLEIIFLAGLAIGAAAHRIAVVLDGFIATSAGLVANALCPDVKQYLFASHCSVEPGHQLALTHLGLEPYLDLQLRLGEGSGAALALPLFAAATAIVNDMATFESAGVCGPIER